jgi:hypothetical protein
VNETQLLAVAALALFAGSTLLLSQIRWFRRRPLVDRLAPYVPGGSTARSIGILVSAEGFGQVIGPLARAVGERVARAVGVTEPLAVRLERTGSTLDVTAFRVRQLGWAAVGLLTGSVLAVATQQSGPVALLLIVTAVLIMAFLGALMWVGFKYGTRSDLGLRGRDGPIRQTSARQRGQEPSSRPSRSPTHMSLNTPPPRRV